MLLEKQRQQKFRLPVCALRLRKRLTDTVNKPLSHIGWRALRLVLPAAMITLGLFLLQSPETSAQPNHKTASLFVLDGNIDRVSERYLQRSIAAANERNDVLIIIRIDTPGGLLDSTRKMVEDIFMSDVPVVTYVGPSGAQAGSAGAFIGAAGAFLGMAPATNIGASSPVASGGQDIGDTLEAKVTEDAAAFIRSIAEKRGRDPDVFASMVYESKAFSAQEAVEQGAADGVFENLEEMVFALDEKVLDTASGPVKVITADLLLTEHSPSAFERLLALIADPNIAFLLVSLGGLALTIEIFNFGSWIPGVLGIGLLAVGFAGVGLLPFHWAGVALLGFAIVLFIAEAAAPGIGFFGATGAVALILGGLFLFGFFGVPGSFDAPIRVNRWLLISIGIIVGLFVLWIGREARKSISGESYVSPSASLEGKIGVVSLRLHPMGQLFLEGEEWTAELLGSPSAEVGEKVRVEKVEGLKLFVQALDKTNPLNSD